MENVKKPKQDSEGVLRVLAAVLLTPFNLAADILIVLDLFAFTLASDLNFPAIARWSAQEVTYFLGSWIPLVIFCLIKFIIIVLMILVFFRKLSACVLTLGINAAVLAAVFAALSLFAGHKMFPYDLRDALVPSADALTAYSFIAFGLYVLLAVLAFSVHTGCRRVMKFKKQLPANASGKHQTYSV